MNFQQSADTHLAQATTYNVETAQIVLTVEFYIESPSRSAAVEKFALQRMKSFLAPKTSSINMSNYVHEDAFSPIKSDYQLVSCALDPTADDYDDQNCHFFGIRTRPMSLKDAQASFMALTDLLSSDDFQTTEHTDFSVHIVNKEDDKVLNPLALALNIDDHSILDRMHSADSYNVENPSFLVESIIKGFFEQPELSNQFNEETPLHEWLLCLNDIAQDLVEDGVYTGLTSISQDCSEAIFDHFGGKDCVSNTFEMMDAKAHMHRAFAASLVQNSHKAFNAYWQQDDMVTKLKALVNVICEIKRFTKTVSFKRTSAEGAHPVRHAVMDGNIKIGSSSRFISPATGNILDKQQVRINDMLIFVPEAKDVVAHATILYFKSMKEFQFSREN